MKPHAPSRNSQVDEEAKLARILEAYLAHLENGRAPDREAIIAANPDIAERLRACLSSLQFVNRAACDVTADRRKDQPTVSKLSGTLGDFRIVREVGRGGMGVVYEAEQISLNRRVALKVLPFAAVLDSKHLQRFKTEAQAAARLHHQNIVPVHSVGCERGVHYYAMQFIEGMTLAEVIRDLQQPKGSNGKQESSVGSAGGSVVEKLTGSSVHDSLKSDSSVAAKQVSRGEATASTVDTNAGVQAGISTERSTQTPLYFRSVARLGADVADALEYAHSDGVIHRDIKPSNLIVDTKGQIWVTDFGLARIQSDPELTMSGDLVGTLRYMSPEQALAKRVPVDHRADVYSLGATLYEALTLHPAFPGRNREELLRRIAFEEPKPMRRLNRAVPAELQTIVLKAMAKNPTERYSTAGELADDLRRYLDDRPILARRPTLSQQMGKWARRHRSFVWTAAVMLALGSMASTWQAIRATQAEHQVRTLLAYERQVNRERESVNSRLSSTLAEADQLRLEATAATLDSPDATRLSELVERVATLAASELARPQLASRARLLRQTLEEQRSETSLQTQLHAARGITHNYFKRIAYRDAFKAIGIDPHSTTAEDASQWISQRGRDLQRDIMAGLDDWRDAIGVSLRRATAPKKHQRNLAEYRWLSELAGRIDGDVLRLRMRAADKMGDAGTLLELARSEEIENAPPYSIAYLGTALSRAGEHAAALALLRQGQRRHPDDVIINMKLFYHLYEAAPPRYEEALRIAMVCVALEPKMCGQYINLGAALLRTNQIDAAIEAYRRAVELAPDLSQAHRTLGLALAKAGEYDEAIAECRKAVELRPENSLAHYSLGTVLWQSGDLDSAINAYQSAIALSPEVTEHYHGLGRIYFEKRCFEQAARAFHKILELDSSDATAYYWYGNSLNATRQYSNAVSAFQKAIELQPEMATAYCNLGHNLLRLGDFDSAVAAFRRGHVLGTKDPRWKYPSGVWLEQAEQCAALAPNLENALTDVTRITDNSDRLGYALVCYYRGEYAAGVALYQEAFRQDPQIAEDFGNGHRYTAALMAVLAADKQSDTADEQDESQLSRWREQARVWLRAELDAVTRFMQSGDARHARAAASRMQFWQIDEELSSVRDAEGSSTLPAAQRSEWERFWNDVKSVEREASQLGATSDNTNPSSVRGPSG